MTFLIIDDNSADRRLLSIHLEGIYKENTIFEAETLDEAVGLVNKEEWDIIFLDLGLPDSEGINTIRTMIISFQDIPVIVLTGNEDLELARYSLRIGAADFLEKDHLNQVLLEKSIIFAQERQQARERIEHHISFLEVLRSIDLKIQENEPLDDTLKFICEKLMAVGEYNAVWAVHSLHDSESTSVNYEGNCAFSKLMEEPDTAMNTCNLAMYLKNHLEIEEQVFNDNYHTICHSCPLGIDHGKAGFMGFRLGYQNETYGYIVAIGDSDVVTLPDEQLLFTELAKSISQMLYTREVQNREKEMDDLRNKLHEFERLETLGRLAGGMAHDFNNQLTAIIGNAEMLEFELENHEDPELLEAAKDIIACADISTDLARDVLQFSRGDKKNFVEFHLMGIIDHAAKIIRRSLPKTINLHVNFAIDDLALQGIPNKIENALLNLSINGADAMERNGDLSIVVEEKTIEPSNALCPIFEITPGTYVAISVRDTGSGIPKEIQNKIFSPFFTTKAVDKGTGLGLPSVVTMVREHRGALEFDSIENEGSTFTLYLPKEKQHEKQKIKETHSLITGTGTILLVDDEKGVRLTAQKLLSRLGYTVTACEMAVEAFDDYKSDPEQFDIVITDLDMPGIDGLDFLKMVRDESPNQKAILVTGHSIINISETLKNFDHLKVIQKPYKLNELSQVIHKLLEE